MRKPSLLLKLLITKIFINSAREILVYLRAVIWSASSLGKYYLPKMAVRFCLKKELTRNVEENVYRSGRERGLFSKKDILTVFFS